MDLPLMSMEHDEKSKAVNNEIAGIPMKMSSNPLTVENIASFLTRNVEAIAAPPDFDLSRYISRYSGKTAVNRLLYIASRCPSLSREAYSIALQLIKTGYNLHSYHTLILLAGQDIEPEGEVDRNFCESVEKRNRHELERLENKLNSNRDALSRSGIWKIYLDLGDTYYECGDMQAALNEYSRMNLFCISASTTTEMYLRMIRVYIDIGNLVAARQLVNRCIKLFPLEERLESQVKCCLGLLQLAEKAYGECARTFLSIQSDVPEEFNAIMSTVDVVLYGCLMSVMSMTQAELENMLKENEYFTNCLERVEPMKNFVRAYLEGLYNRCNEQLQLMKNELLLDIHLEKHVTAILDGITDTILLDYLLPFKCALIGEMSQRVGISVAKAEERIAHLIISKKLSARIDLCKGAITIKSSLKKVEAIQEAIRLNRQIRLEMQSALIRASLLDCNLVVAATKGFDINDSAGWIMDEN